MPRTQAEIDAEKSAKSRPDLLPASALMAAGRVMAYGLAKHGPCTWRVAGTEQADSRTHVASMVRHALEVANDIDALDPESGLEQLACVITQACIAYDCRVAERTRELAEDGVMAPSEVRAHREAQHALSAGSAFAAGAIEGENPRPGARKRHTGPTGYDSP